MAKHTKYTEEDVNWAKSLIESHFAKGDKITKSKVVAKGLILNYTERFKIGVTVDALTCWLKRVHNPEEFKKYEKAYAERKKLKINPATVFEQSKYIVVVGTQVMGFETSEEVKQFLSNSKILGGVKMFKQVEFEIKYEVIIK